MVFVEKAYSILLFYDGNVGCLVGAEQSNYG